MHIWKDSTINCFIECIFQGRTRHLKMMNYSITILICAMAEKALGSESACEPFLESQEGFMEEVLFKQSLEFCFYFLEQFFHLQPTPKYIQSRKLLQIFSILLIPLLKTYFFLFRCLILTIKKPSFEITSLFVVLNVWYLYFKSHVAVRMSSIMNIRRLIKN